jgi:LacI family transcriptional regulator
MQQKVTVYDIAKDLGISAGTVSRVLNNSSLISDERRRRILRRAEELGYHKRAIRRPSGRAILNIALFLPTPGLPHLHLFYDPAELIAAVSDGFEGSRTNVITALNRPSGGGPFESKKVGDIDGCIFAFTSPSAELSDYLHDRDIPFVLLNRVDPAESYINVDSHSGMERLFSEWERRNGDRVESAERILFLDSSPVRSVADARWDGLRAAAATRGMNLSDDRRLRARDPRSLDVARITDELARGCPWLCCVNDVTAVSVWNLLNPKSVSLTGFDCSPVRDLIPVRIPTLRLPVGEMGRRAAGWLRERILSRSGQRLAEELAPELVSGDTWGSEEE